MTQISNKKMIFFLPNFIPKNLIPKLYIYYDTMAQLQYAEEQNHALMNIVIEW